MLELIPLAISLLPALGKVIGSLAGDKVGGVITDVTEAAKKVFGTSDPADVSLLIAQDTNKKDMFIAELNGVNERYKLQIEDTQNARAQTVALAASGSSIAWGAPIVSVLVVLGFFFNLYVVLTFKLNFNETTGQVALVLLGSLGSAFTQVINYWLGTSASSRDKDANNAALTQQIMTVFKKGTK